MVRLFAPSLLLLFAALGCRAPLIRPDVANEWVNVVDVTPVFEGDGKATLSLTLDVLPLGEDGAVEAVDWELWLNTRHFASGVQVVNATLASRDKTRLSFTTPLVYRGLPSALEPTRITASVRGGVRVRLRTTEARYPFEHVSRPTLANVPVFEGADED